MSALAFTKSPDYNDGAKCHQFLLDKGVELPEGLTAQMPAVVFHGYFTTKAIADWDRQATMAELKEQAKGAWKEWIDAECSVDNFKQKSEGIAEGADLKYRKVSGREALVINSNQMINWVLEQLEQKRAEVIDAKMDTLYKPKYKSKGTGKRAPKRDASEFECVITNTANDPQGSNYQYNLPSDSNQVFLKDGKIQKGKGANGKDRKPQTYKAVKKDYPFLTRGGCCGGITWDRAAGSKCLQDLGIKGSFVMGCSNNPVDGSDFCAKCDGKKSSVYETTYKSGKYKGYTHAQVLWILDEMDVPDGGKVLAEGDNGWVQEKVGSNWK
tara:strand:- start:387 stop:1364 length:978 start_codon:yes stop_codon:yes gene_type:complete